MTDEQAVKKMRNEAKKDGQLEQNQKEEPMSFFMKVMLTGFFGGIIWSLLGYFSYIFHFTTISPNIVLTPFALGDWKYEPLGQFVGVFIIGSIGVVVALLYYATLKNAKSIWVSIFYGVALWGVVFYLLNPMFPDLESVEKLDMNTNITNLCLYILFGVFVGYTISFDQQEFVKGNE